MLRVLVLSDSERREFDHSEGPLEFGRAARSEPPRCVVDDPYVSRDHLRIEELEGGWLRVRNLSKKADVRLDTGRVVEEEQSCDARLPTRLQIGGTQISIRSVSDAGSNGARGPRSSDETKTSIELDTIVDSSWSAPADAPTLAELGESPDIETLLRWFETVVRVQNAAATSEEFLEVTARAVVDLVGLDRGMVLRRTNDEGWSVAAAYSADPSDLADYSTSVLERVLERRETYFDNLELGGESESLIDIETVVAAPVFDDAEGIVAVVYGSRSIGGKGTEMRPLDAQVVQVLAAAVGAGLAREHEREEAVRSRLRFEQFFSKRLASELAQDPSLLSGREREVTVVFSDVRDFTRMSAELGPARTFELMQEVMELQSHWIREYDGVVVDYVGDGLLAMWNAPSDQPDHAERACRAVLAFLDRLPELNERWSEVLAQPLRLGVGVSTGTALVGNTGSRVKLKYGPMGPTVNLASRVEEATKELCVAALVTGTTRERLPDSFALRRLGRASFQGITKPVELFELHAAELTTDWARQRDAFEQALSDYESRRWVEASRALSGLMSSDEQFDVPSVQLLSRTVEAMKAGRAPFDPVLHLE